MKAPARFAIAAGVVGALAGVGVLLLARAKAPGPVRRQELIVRAADAASRAPARDADSDGLPDDEETRLGTDPHHIDTDGDGIWDSWEVRGYETVHLPAFGVHPRRKDLLVEMDYMVRRSPAGAVGLAPDRDVLARIVAVFADAPIVNHDGSRGIRLHLHLDQEIPHVRDVGRARPYLAQAMANHFAADRRPVFHYMVWVDHLEGGHATGWSDVGASAFLVSLGSLDGGSNDEKVGTFLHEMGHNLGLEHGGSDRTNDKPNYFSVMNHTWQLQGLHRHGRYGHYGFQGFSLAPLDEARLDETRGLGNASDLVGYSTFLYQRESMTRTLAAADGPLDWNGDGKFEAGAATDVNGDEKRGILDSMSDWERVSLVVGSIGLPSDAPGFIEFFDVKRAKPEPIHEPPVQRLLELQPR